jgi:hypothetical protein
MPDQWKKSIIVSVLLYQFARRVIKLTVIITIVYPCYQFHTKFFRISFSHGLSPYIDKIIGGLSMWAST